MFLKNFDFLSPPITLYYKSQNSHSSFFSVILTILAYFICLVFAFFYTFHFINNSNPNAYYYNRFVEEAGEFPVNASSMFSFIQIKDTRLNIPDIVDFDILNIIGIEETIDNYNYTNLDKYNHWLYGPCNNSTDIEGIEELITFDHFTESACIRKYYNKDDKKYYNTDDINFIWPRILHGCGHPNRTFYGIIVEKCRNNTLKLLGNNKMCKPDSEIKEYVKLHSINLKIIDQYTDMFNYTTPYKKYFYSISNGIYADSSSYTSNNLNFNPSQLISDDGLVLENKKNTLSYLFDINEKVTFEGKEDTGIYVAYYFWMQRRMQYYERIYKKIQDIMSDVGGLCSIILTVSESINFLVNKYVILLDIQDYMNDLQNSKEYDKDIFRINKNDLSKINIKNNHNKLFPPKLNKSRYKEENDDFNKNIKAKRAQKNALKINNSSLTRNHILIHADSLNLNNDTKKIGQSLSYKYKKNIMKEKIKIDSQSNLNLTETANHNNNINKDKNIIENIKKKANNENQKDLKLTFISYLFFLISFRKCHSNIQIFSDFRIKMISEENLIKCNLNIDKLMQKIKTDNANTNQDLEAKSKTIYK